MSKSKDLREAAVAYKKAGNSYEDTGKVFGVSASTVHRWVRQYEETGDLSNKPLNRSFKKTDPEKLKAYVALNSLMIHNRKLQMFLDAVIRQ